MPGSRSRRRRLSALMVLIAVAVLLVAACTKESTTEPPIQPSLTVNQFVETTGWFPTVVADSTVFTQSRFDSTTGGGDGLACAEYLGNQVRGVERLTILQPASAVHWPGSILQFATLDELEPAVVAAPRAGGQLVLTGADGATVTAELALMDAGDVAAWLDEAFPSLPSASGNWELEASEIRDVSRLPLAIGVHPAAFPIAVRDQLTPADPDRGAVLVRLQRTHHRLAAAYPGRAGNAFAEGVTGDDLVGQMAEDNPPVWLGEVHYGELVLVLVEAEAPFPTVLDACVNTFLAAVRGDSPAAGRPILSDLPGLAVSVHAAAADADQIADAAASDLEALTLALAAPPGDPPSLPPIAASLQALRNGGPLTLGLEGVFEFIDCEPHEAVFGEVLWSLDAADARTEVRRGDLRTGGDGFFYYHGGSGEFEYDQVVSVPDLRGRGRPSTPDRLGEAPVLHQDFVGGRPAIELFELGLPGGLTYSRFNIDGEPFVGESYTLFLVIGIPGIIRLTVEAEPSNWAISVANDLGLIMHGANSGQRDFLELGFIGRELTYHHGQFGLTIPHVRPQSWHVYAFRFGPSAGMTIWLDGVVLGQSGWDRSLLDFSGAKFGARRLNTSDPDHAVLWLAEAVAYRGAGSDDEVLAETARLREKYGF